jgi:hypothetical protein
MAAYYPRCGAGSAVSALQAGPVSPYPIAATTVSCGTAPSVQPVVGTNRLNTTPTITYANPVPAPKHTISYVASATCGSGAASSAVGYGLGAAGASCGGGGGLGIITVDKTCGVGGGNCSPATRPGYIPRIGGYLGNPSIQYCTINSEEFCPYRLSSGTYQTFANNIYNSAITNLSGLVFQQNPQYSCGVSPANIVQFSTHWMQMGCLFKISGTAGALISPTNSNQPGTTGGSGNVPYPQFLVNLPIVTNISNCATLSGIADATVLLYPSGQAFSNNGVVPIIYRRFPVLFSLRFGCTSTDAAGILLSIGAPLGLNDGVAFPVNVQPTLAVQFEITIDLGGTPYN